LCLAPAFDQKLQRERGLAGAGIAVDEIQAMRDQSAVQHVVEAGDSRRAARWFCPGVHRRSLMTRRVSGAAPGNSKRRAATGGTGAGCRTICWVPVWNPHRPAVGLEHLLLEEHAADSVVLAFDDEHGP